MAAYRNVHQIARHQRGLTLVGLVSLLLVFGLCVIIGAKFAPVYFESYKVGKTLESLNSDQDFGKRSDAELIAILQKRLAINDVKHVGKEQISVSVTDHVTHVRIAYEVRVHLLGNMDVVTSFDKQADIQVAREP